MSGKTYRNLFIQVSTVDPVTKKYEVRVAIGSPGGTPGFDETETCTFDANVFVVVDSGGNVINLLERIKTRVITEQQLFKLGEILCDLIFPGSIRRRLLDSLTVVREAKGCLRIRLSIEANELKPLPWEYVYLDSVGTAGQVDLNFLALQPDISIIRHEAIDFREPRVDKRERYRLVAALASPPGQLPLNVKEDRRAIERMISQVEKIKGTSKIDPFWVENATPTTLFEAFRSSADIFHFAGHGSFTGNTGQILLETDDHTDSTYYDATQLKHLMGGVKLAVLGACESAQSIGENVWGGVAQALVQAGVAAVVGSQFRLEDRNAAPLTEELYRGVLAGDTVDESVSNARRAIRNLSGLENRDWGALVLYLRVEDGVIFPRDETAISSSPIPRIAPTPLQTSLIGRDAEINRIQSDLRGSKYHFHGVYGVGKTSLATQLFTHAVKGDAFTDGYLWYRVDRGEKAANVLEWIGAQFGDQTVAEAKSADDKINALRDLLSERSNLLLGLDEVNDSNVARAVIEAAGDCTVVLNGPKTLGLSDKSKEYGLTTLTSVEATHLFINLINRSLAEVNEDDQQKIREICEKMGNLPLAIKLAALKHAEGESLTTIQERLAVAPATIVDGRDEVKTIFAAIYADLETVPAASRLLIRVASFPTQEAPLGPLRADEDDIEFFQAKDKLLALGLVNPAGTDRLAMHPLLGQLAHAQADKKVAADERNRVADWLLNYAHEHATDYESLEREHRNLLGAFDWFDKARKPIATISLLKDLIDYLRVRGYWQEARARLDRAMRFAKQLNLPNDLGWAHLHLGIILTQQGDYSTARVSFVEAESVYKSTNNQAGCGQAVYRRSNVSFLEGKLTEALQVARQSLELMGENAAAKDRSGARARVASILATQGNLDDAREQYDAALNIAEENHDIEEQASVHLALGRLLRKAGKHEEALAQYQLSFKQYKSIGHVRDMAILELEMGHQHYYQGNYKEALKHFNRGIKEFELLKYKLGLAIAHHALGNVAYSQARSDDDLDAAEKEYRQALAINRDDLKAAIGAARNLYQLGVIAQRRGRDDEAMDAYKEVEIVARREQDLGLLAGTLHQLGRLDFDAGNLQQAGSLADQALMFAKQSEDRLTEVSALSLIGLIKAREGNESEARETLETARAAFHDLKAPEASKVEKLLEELERWLNSSQPFVGAHDYIDVMADAPVNQGGGTSVVIQGGGEIDDASHIDVMLDLPTNQGGGTSDVIQEGGGFAHAYIKASYIDVMVDPPENQGGGTSDKMEEGGGSIDVVEDPFDAPPSSDGGRW